MSLTLDLKYLVGLTGKGDRRIKVLFREAKLNSRIATGHDSVYFGQRILWPVSRSLDDKDVLILKAYQIRKGLPDSLLGSVTINLYPLTRDVHSTFRENLVNSSHHPTGILLLFELRYQSPDSSHGDLDDDLVNYPLADTDYSLDDAENEINQDQPPPISSFVDLGDDLNQIIDHHLAEDEEWEVGSQLSAPERKDPRIAAMLGPTIYRSNQFQLGINVVEARKLVGTNINPMITVTVGKSVQKTVTKYSTNCPFYDNYFAYDFDRPKISVLTEVIRLRVFNMRSHPLARLLPGKLVGEFVTDVQTIYNEKDHLILNKWAVLIDPKDPWKGPTGYVKVDMHVIEEGQQVKRIRREKPDHDEIIENHLLLPRYSGMSQKRIMLSMKVSIYQAEDLPPMNTEISNRIRKAFVGENTPNLDSYVEVSYAGHTAKTKTERYTYNPIWNETIEFCDYFPSFTRTIRINVRNGGIKGELIATRLIDIRDIMCHITGRNFPHFGPSWINLYGTPRIYTYAQMLQPEAELNQALGEGVAYRGRLLLAIRSMEDEDVIRIGTTKYVANPISETAAGKKSLYFLFACFSEASVIEKKLGAKNKPISFEMSFGIYGNKLDGKRGGVEPQMLELAQPNETREQVDWCYSTTPPMLPSTEDKEYYYLNFGRKKPCLYLTGYYEDHRSRMCIPNIVEKLSDEFYYQIQRVKHLFIRRRITDAKNYLRTVFLTMAKKFNLAQESIRSCRDTASTTLLDREYSRRIRRDLRRMALLMINLSKQVHKHTLGEKIKDANGLHKRLCNLTNCPQDGLPDVFISMIMDNQRVGFVRIPARDIYYSVVDCERGKWSGQMATLYLRKQGREGVGSKGWRIQSQIRVYLWLGLIKDFVTYTNGLPSGYDKNIFKTPKPPNELIYLESSRFQLRCYIFIARDLIASDSSGMSDPMARILIGSHVLQTQVLYQTMSPMWDVLLYKQVTFYQSAQSVKQNLQEVIVEIFDIDPGNDLEFMGRCFCEVNVTLDGEKYKPPRLQWWPVFRGQTPGGELLAAFDLIQEDTRVPFENLPTFEELTEYTKEFDDRVILKSIPGMYLDDEDDLNKDSDGEDDVTDGEMNTIDDFDDLIFDADSVLLLDNVDSCQLNNSKRKQIKIGMAPPKLVLVRRKGDYRIPDNIRPPLQRFRIEVLFWSVWGMVRQHLLPVKRPRVVVEIGGHKLESEIIKDLSKLPIFDIPLKAMDVYLPVDERYWPPLVFTCFDNRILGTKITIGSHTISNARDYLVFDTDTQASDNSSTVYMDSESDGPGKLNFGFGKGEYLCNQEPNSEMSTTRKTSERGFESTKSIDTSGSIVQLLADMNPSFQQYNLKYKLPDDAGDLDLVSIDGNDIAGTGGEKRSPDALPGQAHLVTTHSGPTPEQLATADWWTRFYVTIRSGETNFDDSRYKNEVNPLTESEDSDIEEKLEKIDVKPDKDSEEEIDETNGTKPNYLNYKQKKKCWQRTKQAEKKKLTALEKRQLEIARRRARIEKRKKNKKNLKAKIKARFIDSKGLFLKEFVDLNYDVETQEDQSWVETILVYPVALEEVPDFNGFNTPFQNLPFYKGKQLEDNTSESRITGFFKGNLVIYPVNDDEPLPTEVSQLRLYKTLPIRAKLKLTVRLYVIRAIKLHPSDPNGKSDPYLIVSLGKSIINDRDDYKPKTLNPVFGKYYEFVAHLPMDSLLSIQLMDHERVGADTLIGETHIDIENRFHSAHRATCGLMPKYYAHGYCQWKDSQQPTEILSKLCEKYGIEQPVYNILENKITIGSETFFANTEIRSETGITIKSVEPLALEALHNWPLIIKKDVKLVSEHVETRSLKHPDNPGLIQGRLQMWIDMFEREVAVPPPAINISPRVPAGYELRVIVWNTADVKLTDTSLFSSERSSDIYVKGWIKGVGIDDQKTDVHYRSLSGEGNFNWRFIFPFDYIKAEDRIIYPIKGTFDIEPHMIKANCELTLQVWDADIIASDNFIGSISMRLSSLPRCAKTAKSCGLHQLEPDCPKFSMFKNRTARGWWPVTDEVEEEIVVQGKVECQLEMLNSAEAESNPAGLGRDEPNGLPKPNRPDSSFMKFLGPLNTLRYLIKYRLKWILIKIFIIFLVCLIIFLFLYSFPGAIVQKMVNG
ncbi:Otoferlin [Schistosoma japonicum]|uniref:Otoferlin n=3 Tax=Schistosoma japonicum TaxID=6182 RepID=A0A4Z2CZP8_SCHJA|nr:Otoferlin [Schistosoma japonicum]